jgi:hypothetical protein
MVVRAEIAQSIPRLAEGFVERGGSLDSIGIGRDRGTAEMIAQEEAECPVRAVTLPQAESSASGSLHNPRF